MHSILFDQLTRRNLILALAAGALSAPLATCAFAQDADTKPVRVIAPNAAGGITDLLARFVADFITRESRRQAIVDNITGGAGTIATRTIARAAPDGATLGLLSTGDVLVAQHLFEIGFDPATDMRPIAMVARAQQLLVINADLPAKTLREFIDYARDNPSKVNFGSSGAGSITHIGAELFARLAGLQLTHVPYRGAAPAVLDLLSGQIQMMHMSLAPIIEHVRSGKLRILAFASTQRSAYFPDIPTGAEAGLPGYENDVWFALFGPRGTPDSITHNLNAVVAAMLSDAAIRQRMTNLFLEPAPMTPDAFAAYVAAEAPRWKKTIVDANIKVE